MGQMRMPSCCQTISVSGRTTLIDVTHRERLFGQQGSVIDSLPMTLNMPVQDLFQLRLPRFCRRALLGR